MRMRPNSRRPLTATAAVTLSRPGAPRSPRARRRDGRARPRAAGHPGDRDAGQRHRLDRGVPAIWNGTLILYSHGFGPLTAADAPDPNTQAGAARRGYALAGSSYDPNNSEWALDTAVSDQFGTLAAVESTVLPRRPRTCSPSARRWAAWSAPWRRSRAAAGSTARSPPAASSAGGVNLNEYQIDGEYAIAQLLGDPATQLVGFGDEPTALGTAAALTADAAPGAGHARPGRPGSRWRWRS